MKVIVNKLPHICSDVIGLDTETALTERARLDGFKINKSTPYHQELKVISIYDPTIDTGYVLYYDAIRKDFETWRNLKDALANREISKVIHNAVFDMHFLHSVNLDICGVFCTLTMSQAIYGGDLGVMYKRFKYSPYSLKGLVKILYGIELDKEYQSIDWDSEEGRSAEAVKYAALDAYYHLKVYEKLTPMVKDWKTFGIEMYTLASYGRMNRNGLSINITKVEKLKVKLEKILAEKSVVFESVNFRSPKQVIAYFKFQFGFDVPFVRQKSGKLSQSTAKQQIYDWLLDEQLEQKIVMNPLPNCLTNGGKATSENVANMMREMILDLADCRYVSWLLGVLKNLSDPYFNFDGRVHTIFQPLAFSLSKDDPNGLGRGSTFSGTPAIQILPKRSRLLSEHNLPSFRSIFEAPPGRKIVSLDIAGSHVQIATLLSKDEELVRCHETGIKVHHVTLSGITRYLGLNYTPEQCAEVLEDSTHPEYTRLNLYYRLAKILFFAELNCAGAKTLQEQFMKERLRVSMAEIEGLLKAYRQTYAGLVNYTKTVMNRAKSNMVAITIPDPEDFTKTVHGGYLCECRVTFTKQRFYLNPLFKTNRAVSSQWLAAEAAGMKLFICTMDRYIRENPHWEGMIVAMIHDELVFEVNEAYAEEFVKLAQEKLGKCMNAVIPGFKNVIESPEKLIKNSW